MRAAAISAMAALAQWAMPAAAQSTRETASINALATIKAPELSLAITGSSDLSFGKVTLPTGKIAACAYDISNGGDRASYTDGTTASGTACAFQDNGQSVGTISIACQSGQSLTFTRSVEAPLQAQAIDFQIVEGQIGFPDKGSAQTYAICTDGKAVLNIGGQLTVKAGATAQDSATVGRVTVDLFYGSASCTNCQ